MSDSHPYNPFAILGEYLMPVSNPYISQQNLVTPEASRRADLANAKWRIERLSDTISYAQKAAEEPWHSRSIHEVRRLLRSVQDDCKTCIESYKSLVDQIDRDAYIKDAVARELAKATAPDQPTSKS